LKLLLIYLPKYRTRGIFVSGHFKTGDFMHECYNPYGGRVIELNEDGSGIIKSNFKNEEQYVFRSDQVFGNKSGLQKGSSITFTLNTENKIHCVHTRN